MVSFFKVPFNTGVLGAIGPADQVNIRVGVNVPSGEIVYAADNWIFASGPIRRFKGGIGELELPTKVGANPVDFEYMLEIEIARPGEKSKTYGPYYKPAPTSTADAPLAGWVGESSVPATWMTNATAQLQAKVDEAEAIKQYVNDVSNIDTTVSAVDFALGQPGPAATLNAAFGDQVADPASPAGQALTATFATAVPVTRLGVFPDLGTNQSAAIQAAIDTGYHLYFPPGVYLANNLTARKGMRLTGGGKGDPDASPNPRTVIRTTNGDLFVDAAHAVTFATIEHMELTAMGASAGAVIRGDWSQGSFRSVRLRQYQPGQHVVNVRGWIDMVIEGESEILGHASATVPLFKGITGTGDIAQFAFRDTRFTGGRNYAIWLEATSGVIMGADISNVNFEVTVGGAIKLLSCRNVSIARSGVWDLNDFTLQDFIYIGKSTSNHQSGNITISDWTRDATLAPSTGVYEIKAEATVFDLNIINCGHQTLSTFRVDAGGAQGRVIGSKITLLNGQNMSTDAYQTYTPALSGTGTTLGDGTAAGVFQRNGKTVNFRATFVLGPTTTIGTTTEISLPVAMADTTSYSSLAGTGVDTGTASFMLAVTSQTTTNIRVRLQGTAGAIPNITSTTPFTWAHGDILEVRGTYQTA